jgi:glycosyltransferase involved in cell wall biosynthesis
MRIAVWHHLPSGGGKRALYEHLRGLVDRGHSIEAWCPATADVDYLPLSSLNIPEHQITIDVRTNHSPLKRFTDYAKADTSTFDRLHAMDLHARKFADIVNAGHFDLVFANSCRWFCTPMVARYLRIPSALYLQEPCRWLYEADPPFALPWIAEPDPELPWWHPRTIRHWLAAAARVDYVRVQGREELTSIKAFDRVLVNSRFSRESLLRSFGIDARVCGLGVDTLAFTPGGPKEHFALSVGAFWPNKNPSFVVRAVAASRHKPVLVWVANEVKEEYFRRTTQLATQLGVSIEMKRRVSERELIGLYQRAAVLLYAPVLEPFGLAPLEAGSCGTPVVAVAEGGVRETVVDGETGLLVDNDPKQMGDALDRLLGNPAEARRLGDQGAARVRTFWAHDAATDRIEAALWSVVSGAAEQSLSSATNAVGHLKN